MDDKICLEILSKIIKKDDYNIELFVQIYLVLQDYTLHIIQPMFDQIINL